MLTGFEVIARPKRAREDEEEDRASQVPMRPERRGEQRRNPSTDQRKIRHQQRRKTADAHTDAEAAIQRAFTEDPRLARVTFYAPTAYGQFLAREDIELSRRTAAVSYATTLDSILNDQC